MNHNSDDLKLGRFLSLILRHDPGAAGITLDENGWADVNELITGTNRTGRTLDFEILQRIVLENNKNRYSFNEDQTKIRANQGHSIEVDVELEKQNPPDILYHGTASRFLDSIMKEGLKAKERQYVHLSADIETAVTVGKRHGVAVVLEVDTKSMVEDGAEFWISKNKVWLCKSVPVKYL